MPLPWCEAGPGLTRKRHQTHDGSRARTRRPEIVADAASEIVSAPSTRRTGELLIDEDVLREAGVTDFSPYSYSGRDEGLDDDFFLE